MKFILKSIIASLIFSGVACTKNEETTDGVSAEKYNEMVTRYNDQVKKYNKVIKETHTTDNLMVETSLLVAKLDDHALRVRKQTRKIREGIGQYVDVSSLKADMQDLDRLIQDALKIVGDLENQTSKKNIEQVIGNADLTVKEKYQEDQKNIARLAGAAVGTLSGIRDLFLSQYSDLVSLVNFRISQLPNGVIPRDIDPSREGELAPEGASPIVDSFDGGGRIDGIARNSVSGLPVTEAFVGFKRKKESTDYFYQTQTDSQGQYQSPYLLPGTYYVDIHKDGYINVQDQPVKVKRGQKSRENISLSEPLEDGVYRVTMSWTSETISAVKDVDSYLSIPGVSVPLSYQNKGRRYHGAYLDRDDTNWIGPETTTIHELKNGSYVYYVNNYSSRNNQKALGNSDVRVKLYKGSQLIKSFRIPQGEGLSYEVFRIVDGELKLTGQFSNRLKMH